MAMRIAFILLWVPLCTMVWCYKFRIDLVQPEPIQFTHAMADCAMLSVSRERCLCCKVTASTMCCRWVDLRAHRPVLSGHKLACIWTRRSHEAAHPSTGVDAVHVGPWTRCHVFSHKRPRISWPQAVV